MHNQVLLGKILEIIRAWSDPGVFVAMFLESSIVPLPSEVVVAGAAAAGIPLVSILIFGSLGSTCGAMVGYALGRYAAMPVIIRFGKYVLIKPHHIKKAEAFARKYGVWSVLIGRVVPIIPFKVFSIAAGITSIPFIPFVLCTLIGVLPRMYVLSVCGVALVKYTKPMIILLLALAVLFFACKLTKMLYNGKDCKKGCS